MQQSLLETYKRRISVAEQAYKTQHEDSALSMVQKNTIARLLANTSSFLTESFGQSTGTQRADIGEFKKFALDLITVTTPNLIANELVLVHPMTSMTGFLQYVEFVAGSNKGGVKQGDLFNNPFALAPMTEERANYTSAKTSCPVILDAEGKGKVAWAPIDPAFKPEIVGGESGLEVEIIDAAAGEIKVEGATGLVVVKYIYDNAFIPANDLPIYNARMQGIGLQAKVRRIAIYYSQLAAFQAKQEMGMDLGAVLQTQACAELAFEIDSEIVKLLADSAPTDETLKFNKRVRNGLALSEHYEGFAATILKASRVIYQRTQKHAANYMLCAPDCLEVIGLMRNWKPSNRGNINGPYFAGTTNGIKVFVSSILEPGKFVLGFHGDDLMTSAAVYAPYMPIVPTALLQFADGGNSQGYATMYDLKLLNPALLVAGEIVDEADPEAQQVVPTVAA